jgi:hypothetical protein
MRDAAEKSNQQALLTDDLLQQIFDEMDINNDQNIDKTEFIDFMTKAFKNYEDNIEFLAKDIVAMEEKIDEVKSKLSTLVERPTGYYVSNVPVLNSEKVRNKVPLNKGSTLNLHIIDGDFLPEVFGPNFEPMITVSINNGEQTEHTKASKAPNNHTPVWKEILPFDILKPTDTVEIKIINAHLQAAADDKEIISYQFMIAPEVDNGDKEYYLKSQRPIDLDLGI